MKIASWNVNSLNVRLPHLLEWLKIGQPDVLLLDEPTCGLDPERKRRLVPIVAAKCQRTATLIATQDDTWAKIPGARIERLELGPRSVASRSKKTD